MSNNLEQQTIENLTTYTSEKLADIIVSNRYLGLYETIAIAAMEELAKRRINGDAFEYEQYINEQLEKLPKIQLKMPQLQTNKFFNIIRSIIK